MLQLSAAIPTYAQIYHIFALNKQYAYDSLIQMQMLLRLPWEGNFYATYDHISHVMQCMCNVHSMQKCAYYAWEENSSCTPDFCSPALPTQAQIKLQCEGNLPEHIYLLYSKL